MFWEISPASIRGMTLAEVLILLAMNQLERRKYAQIQTPQGIKTLASKCA
jgi:hypothetical protein